MHAELTIDSRTRPARGKHPPVRLPMHCLTRWVPEFASFTRCSTAMRMLSAGECHRVRQDPASHWRAECQTGEVRDGAREPPCAVRGWLGRVDVLRRHRCLRFCTALELCHTSMLFNFPFAGLLLEQLLRRSPAPSTKPISRSFPTRLRTS